MSARPVIDLTLSDSEEDGLDSTQAKRRLPPAEKRHSDPSTAGVNAVELPSTKAESVPPTNDQVTRRRGRSATAPKSMQLPPRSAPAATKRQRRTRTPTDELMVLGFSCESVALGSQLHHDAIQQWFIDGVNPAGMTPRPPVPLPSPEPRGPPGIVPLRTKDTRTLEVMFGFPLFSQSRYNPALVPLADIHCTVDVTVVDDGPFGRCAVARRNIPPKTILGYYEGYEYACDDLLDLHPYIITLKGGVERGVAGTYIAVDDVDDGDVGSVTGVIGDPFCCFSYVDDPQGTLPVLGPNVEVELQRRCILNDVTGVKSYVQWPTCVAIDFIPAGTPLRFNYGNAFWDSMPQRDDVFRALAILARDSLVSPLYAMAQLEAQFEVRADARHWEPLFRLAREAATCSSAADDTKDQPSRLHGLESDLTSYIEPWVERIGSKLPTSPCILTADARREIFAFIATLSESGSTLPLLAIEDSTDSKNRSTAAASVPSALLPPLPVTKALPLRYRVDPGQVSTTALVGVSRDYLTREIVVYARQDILLGQILGWVDGLLVLSDGLINYHCYNVQRTGTAKDTILASPYAWPAHLSYSSHYNVQYQTARRQADSSSSKLIEWPVVVSTRYIAAGSLLALQPDAGYLDGEATRINIFTRLVTLVQAGTSPRDIEAAMRSSKEWDFGRAAFNMSLWQPLFDELQPYGLTATTPPLDLDSPTCEAPAAVHGDGPVLQGDLSHICCSGSTEDASVRAPLALPASAGLSIMAVASATHTNKSDG